MGIVERRGLTRLCVLVYKNQPSDMTVGKTLSIDRDFSLFMHLSPSLLKGFSSSHERATIVLSLDPKSVLIFKVSIHTLSLSLHLNSCCIYLLIFYQVSISCFNEPLFISDYLLVVYCV